MYRQHLHHAWRFSVVLGIASLALAATLSIAQADILPTDPTTGSATSPQWSYTPSLKGGNTIHYKDLSVDPLADHTLFIQENRKENIRSAKFDGKEGVRLSPTAFRFDVPPPSININAVDAPDGEDSSYIQPSLAFPGQTVLNSFSSKGGDDSAEETETFQVTLDNGKTIDVTINSPCEGGNGPGQVCTFVVPEGPSLGFLTTGLLPLGLLALKRRFRIRPSA